jgi:CHAT domain-containing protein/tetratricopeptide (TPR) repeat protein
MEVVSEADRFWAMGGFEVAEKRFRLVLGMLRKVHGPDSNAVAMMLDHIGEFYLDERDFAGAYATFTEALQVRRKTLAAITAPPTGTVATAESDTRSTYRLHLAELLTRLGQMDLSRGALDAAARELAEAVAIGNEPAHRNYVNSLFAVYFQSVLWERQGKRQEAEALWRDAIALRAPLGDSVAFWSAQNELAFFQARNGDFRAAAETARKIATEAADKRLTSEEEAPYTSNRPYTDQSLYLLESSTALNEILAIDAWRSAGPEAAVKLLWEPIDRRSYLILDSGSASERARLLTWFERRVFLHLSMLLDGDPSPEHVKAAYELLCKIKSRYLATETDVHRFYESERGDPHVEDPAHLAELDQLADIRQQIAHRFITSAVYGKEVTGVEFAALETQERTLTRALASDAQPQLTFSFVPPQGSELDDGTVVIDTFKWQRWNRQTAAVLPQEYGAFVTRRGEATRYISLGPAAPIDRDIKTLTTPGQTVTRELLQRLYQHLLAPIESRLSGEIRRFLIVPDGLLMLAPFGALIDERGGYLLERATVGYLNSARDLRAADRPEPVLTSPAVIVANPDFNLSLGAGSATSPSKPRIESFTFAGGGHFEEEARSVAQHLGAENRIVTRTMAREELIASLSGPEVLHLATHSKPNIQWRAPVPAWSLWEYPQPLTADNPALQSLIALAGAGREQSGIEDGFLTGLEVQGLHLVGTKLAVLSSCEAGRDQPVDGEGLLGLRTAFAMAGADGVVTSLWMVDDEAGRKFMEFFYSHLRDGAGAAEALRQSQLQMMRDTPYSSPFYWAGYQYAGKPAPLVLAGSQGARPQPASEQAALVTPHCFEVTAREAPDGNWQTIETVRVKLGAEAYRRSFSATRSVYELASPGSDSEYTWSTSINGGPPVPSMDVQTASWMGWGITLVVERQPNWSGLTIMIGKKDEPVLTLKLKGAPGLFPSLDFPREIPPLSSYKEATLWTNVAARIETIDVCRGGSLR